MSRRKRTKLLKKGAADWMVTYGDMVTLLLTFFVLLFSFSTIDAQKWQALVDSLTGNIGVIDGGKTFYELPGVDDASIGIQFSDITAEDISKVKRNEYQKESQNKPNEVDEFVMLYNDISTYLKENGIPAEVEISKELTEILIRFRDSILFDTGKAELKPEAISILEGVVKVLKEYNPQIDRIRIDGHADSRPINTLLYPTNWDLSAKRAVNVVRYFHEDQGFEPSKLSAAAYGEFNPIEPNNTPEGMARNRRVEIFIVKRVNSITTIKSEGE